MHKVSVNVMDLVAHIQLHTCQQVIVHTTT